MGICGSNEDNLTAEQREANKLEAERARQLEKTLVREYQQDQQINKLLLLGAGESGKSTLFKQMIKIYGDGFDCASYKKIIYNNIITSMKTLLQQCDLLGEQPDGKSCAVTTANLEHKKKIEEMKGEDNIDEDIAASIKALWADEGVQHTYSLRSRFQLTDSAAYFFDQMDIISAPDYVPSEQDVLRSRVRTTGIVENAFTIEDNQFKMYDVGGQRNERKKWIHCFENVTAVLFVAAISAYDMVLYEDETTNRMVEALNLFEEIANIRWFKNTSMILFLNKRDLFAEKIKKVPLTVCFPDYSGDGSYDDAKDFIQQRFEDRYRNKQKRIYSHVTCATDTGNVAAVFNAVKDIIIQISLEGAGLV